MNVFAAESILAIGVIGYIVYEIMKPDAPKPLTPSDILIPGISPAGTPALHGIENALAPVLNQIGAIANYQSGNAQGATLIQPPPQAFEPGLEGAILSAAWPYHDPVTGRPIPIPTSLAGGAPLPTATHVGSRPQQAINGTLAGGIGRRVTGGVIIPGSARI